jgi:hypothetical protein
MSPATKHLLAALAFITCALPARSCSPDFPFAVFVLPNGPGGNYLDYAKGRLGVPQPGYRTRHLVIAFDYLTHHPLPPQAQDDAVDVNDQFLNPWTADQDTHQPGTPSGFNTWISTRATLGPVDGYTPDTHLATDRYVPGGQYDGFTNCLDDAFATAARTLSTLSKTYGPKDPAVLNWTRGQDAVFSNCGDGKAPQYFGPGNPPPPPPAPHPPAAVPANAPLWLQQDRAYQLAAAHFYALDFDAAIASFRAIAADQASPWAAISRYLIARSLIRKATLSDDQLNYPQGTPAQQAAAKTQFLSTLGQAQKELLAMRSDPRMASLQNPVDDLLNYVNLRLQPEAQAVVLAQRLQNPGTGDFAQSLIDLTWLRTNRTDATLPPPAHGPEPDPSGMIAWIDDITNLDQAPNPFSGEANPHTSADVAHATADILHHWQTTHAAVWLVPALMVAKPADASTPDLLRAAADIPATDPAYIAVTYHRLRLQPHDASTRDQLLALLPSIRQHQTPSTLNLFLALDATSAPTLETWLATAARLPADETYGDPSDTIDTDSTPATPTFDVCGTKITPHSTELFDADAANAFNRDLPLRLLADSAESSILPANLRYQVAQAALVRAILLDRPAIAQRMTPLLVHCRAAWAPVLAAYNASSTPDERKVNGLLALMRFASTEPSVRSGEERRMGFATYDEFRQNWWCSTVPQPGGTVDDYAPNANAIPRPALPGQTFPKPLFLTAADTAEAAAEVAALEQIPSASQYLATQALDWYKLHPRDPHTPDILGEADRVIRNACRKDPPFDPQTGRQTVDPHDPTLTANLAHAIYDALHKDYPQSSWAKRYTSWE